MEKQTKSIRNYIYFNIIFGLCVLVLSSYTISAIQYLGDKQLCYINSSNSEICITNNETLDLNTDGELFIKAIKINLDKDFITNDLITYLYGIIVIAFVIGLVVMWIRSIKEYN